MKTTRFIVGLAALVGTWLVEKSAAARLAVQIEAHHGRQREIAELQHKRDRLRALQPSDDELKKLRRAAAECARLRRAVPATPSSVLPLGEWSIAREWQDRGNATPHAAIESTLWAAAGGDVSALKNLLALSDAAREKADALLARLPVSTRDRYATAEDLIAEFTIKSIPLGEAQLVWFNQIGEDDATACLFLQNPPKAGESIDLEAPRPEAPEPPTREEALRAAAQLKAQRAASSDREPPRAPENQNSSETYLSLRRQVDGWRLIVPPSAVDKIAKELQGVAQRR